MADVFISYSRKDMIFADRLVQALKASGRESWIDWEGIPYSADFWREIQAGIDAADNFVFIISPDSLSSRVCNQEVEHARATGKRIIPIVRREPDIKQLAGEWYGKEWEQLARTNWEELRKLNFIFFRKKLGYDCEYDSITRRVTNPENDGPESDADVFEPAFASLLSTAEQDPDHVRQHTRLLVRAREWEANGRRGAYALRGEDLREAELWLGGSGGKDPKTTALQTEFIAASRQAASRQQRTLLGAALVAVVVSLGLAVLAFAGQQQAQQQTVLANNNLATADARATQSEFNLQQSQSLAWAAQAEQRNAAGEPLAALALALEANRYLKPPILAQQTLHDLAYAPGLKRRFAAHSDVLYDVAWNGDGRTFLTVGMGGEVFLWDVEQEQPIRRFSGHTGSVWSVAWNKDGQHFLTTAENGEVFLWDADRPEQPTRRFVLDAGATAGKVVWNADGHTFFTVVGDRATVFLWDVDQPEQPIQRFSSGNNIFGMALSPDGRYFVYATDLNDMRLWDIEQPEGPIHVFDDYYISAIAWNADSQTFLTAGGSGGEVLLWDVEQEQPIRRFIGHDTNLGISSVVWSPDGHTFLSAGERGEMILWDVEQEQPIYRLFGYSGYVGGVAWSPDGQTFLSVGANGEALLWDVEQQPVSRFVGHESYGNIGSGRTSNVWSVAWNNDGEHFLTAGSLDEVFLWDVKQPLQPIQRFSGLDDVQKYDVTWSKDGHTFLTVGSGGEVVLWDVSLEQPIRHYIGHKADGSVRSVAWSRDERTFLTVGTDSEVFLWDTDQPDQPNRRFIGHTGSVSRAAWGPDGHSFLTTGENGEVFLWDVEQPEQPTRRFIGHSGYVWSAAWSPDGRTFLTTGDGSEVFLWDVEQPAQPIRRFTGHSGNVSAAVWNTDGQHFLSAGESGEVFLWDIEQEQPIRRFSGHNIKGFVRSVAWRPDGHAFISTAEDGEVFLWRYDTLDELIQWTLANRVVATLSCNQRQLFAVDPFCVSSTPPVLTPYQTWTPSPTGTAIPALTPTATATVS